MPLSSLSTTNLQKYSHYFVHFPFIANTLNWPRYNQHSWQKPSTKTPIASHAAPVTNLFPHQCILRRTNSSAHSTLSSAPLNTAAHPPHHSPETLPTHQPRLAPSPPALPASTTSSPPLPPSPPRHKSTVSRTPRSPACVSSHRRATGAAGRAACRCVHCEWVR